MAFLIQHQGQEHRQELESIPRPDFDLALFPSCDMGKKYLSEPQFPHLLEYGRPKGSSPF